MPGTLPRGVAVFAVAVFVVIALRTAWVAEDAYITLRTVDNLVHGLGLRWNPDERVQTYTHPLWMFALSAAYFATREAFVTTILLSLLTTSGALLLLVRLSRSGGHALVAVLLLTASRSFIDFSTSGLENPLTHLLVAWFVLQYARQEAPLRMLSLTASLLALSRPDAMLVVVPALAERGFAELRERGARCVLREFALGFLPLCAWESFSLFYYGFLLPNTAYAKLQTGIPQRELWDQGFVYLVNVLAWDPPTLFGIVVGIGTLFRAQSARGVWLGLGLVLYLAYVVHIGGDFMLGRFLTLPLFIAACLIALCELPLQMPAYVAAAALPILALWLHPNAVESFAGVGDFRHSGIADERSHFRDGASLTRRTRATWMPTTVWANEGRSERSAERKVKVHGNVGYQGFFAGPNVHFIDGYAVTEPLLARLPAIYNIKWRVGHYIRQVPEGYEQTVRTGKCAMNDPKLCQYYAALREIISGDLWSRRRFATLVKFNLGAYDHLIDRDRYRYPNRLKVPLADVAAPLEEGARWDGPATRTFDMQGVEIAIGNVSHAAKVALMLDGNDRYRVEFRSGRRTLAELAVEGPSMPHMRNHELSAPESVQREGFDRLVVVPRGGDDKYSLGFVRLYSGATASN